jgi:hypothetical protein
MKKSAPKEPDQHPDSKPDKAPGDNRDTRDNRPPLRREEWAMYADCPEEQHVPCLYYEHARHVPEIREALKRQRQCTDVSELAYRGGLSLYLACVLYPFRRHFPKKPWLDFPDKTRKSFADLTNTKQYLNRRDWESQVYKGYGSCTGSVDKLKDWAFRDGKRIPIHLDHLSHREDDQPVTYFVHRVNWDKSDNVLVAEYRDWLAGHRAARSPKETRGKTSARERLKALAALRWLKYSDWKQAGDETEKIMGKPLYVGQSEWIDAATNAQDFLNAFVPFQCRHVG